MPLASLYLEADLVLKYKKLMSKTAAAAALRILL
jgi:hypothetical protein